jgi:hypothetical protein
MSDRGHEVSASLENPLRCVQLPLLALLCAAVLLAGPEHPAYAGSGNGTFASATFINSGQPNNNNGGASEIYIGNDFENESLRGLVRFNVTGSLSTRAIVTAASVTMYTGTLSGSPPVAATVSLYRVVVPWGQGTGVGADVTGDFTQGQPCSAGGATWNQPQCAASSWSFASWSASASVPATSSSLVTWNSTAGLISDVQGWLDNPASNYGWLLLSSTETTYDSMQPFTKSGQLTFSFACKSGFLDTGTSCSACTVAAQTACVTSQSGNACVDPGPPSGYHCSCGNPAYTGTGTGSCIYVTTTGVTSSPSTTTVFGQPVTFTASVTGSSPTGTVDFLDGATTLCSGVTLASNQAACTPASALSVGSHSIQANYSGDSGNSSSTNSLSQTVDQAASTTAVGTTTSIGFGSGETISVTVAAQSPGVGTPTGSVTIDDGTGDQCTTPLSSGAGSCMLTPTSAGSKTLTATYGGDTNFTGGTGSGSLTVNPASSSTALTTQCMLTFVQGQPFTMTATVTGASPTGNVDFSDGTDTLCSSVALSSSAADCTTSALAVPNAYQLTANYSGDGNNATSLSSSLAVTVLSAADVIFRNGLEAELPSCPIE